MRRAHRDNLRVLRCAQRHLNDSRRPVDAQGVQAVVVQRMQRQLAARHLTTGDPFDQLALGRTKGEQAQPPCLAEHAQIQRQTLARLARRPGRQRGGLGRLVEGRGQTRHARKQRGKMTVFAHPQQHRGKRQPAEQMRLPLTGRTLRAVSLARVEAVRPGQGRMQQAMVAAWIIGRHPALIGGRQVDARPVQRLRGQLRQQHLRATAAGQQQRGTRLLRENPIQHLRQVAGQLLGTALAIGEFEENGWFHGALQGCGRAGIMRQVGHAPKHRNLATDSIRRQA
ncbi:hypothetical protein PSEUDO8AS_40479 [Pseudomonas sp. 8AS]|nr:hypothetical protein PSEUDO8AS_40479 [Pseudomonas sp. 8AS]